MKSFHNVIIIIWLNILFSQVNTEAIRADNKSPGVNHNMALDFSYFSGNTDVIQLMGFYRMDYLFNSNWYGFLSGKYNRAFEIDKEDFSKRGFIHLRTAKPIMATTDIEGFIQQEMNHYIDLKTRELLGAGLRINQVKELYWGIGIMYEEEQYNNDPRDYNFIKSTNYVNYKINILQIVELQNVMYYQFILEEPEKYRILWDGHLNIKASKEFSFHINTHYRFDNNGDSYFEISNGLGFQF